VSDTEQGAHVERFDAEVRELVTTGRIREAAEVVLSRLSPELRPFLHRLLGDVALADEAHSTTCERLWERLGTFRWACSLRSWSYIIARREAHRCRMRHGRGGAHPTTLSKADQVAPSCTSASGKVSTTYIDQLESLRASLSDEDRDLVVLRVDLELAWKDIAAAFLEEDDANPEAVAYEAARVRQRFHAIRVRLAAAMGDRASKAAASDNKVIR
jgi:DNA-directed RNA polymerase specialized sigma24 family protein